MTQVLLKRYPDGLPAEGDFEVIGSQRPGVGPGEMLLRIEWVSIDPAMRTWSARTPGRGEPLPLGSVMRAYGVARVEESDVPDYPVGTWVTGPFGLRTWHVTDGRDIRFRVPEGVPPQTGLGVLGHIGLTAYAGIFRVADVRPGETVLVSSAAGAVGSIAGQLARIAGGRPIGIAGGPRKVALCLDEYGFDACIDRHTVADLDHALSSASGGGLDVYFDNVGGPTLDSALRLMRPGGRIAICGTISVPSADPGTGPRVERMLLDRRLTMRGFLQSEFAAAADEMLADLVTWYRQGLITLREDVVVGLAEAPRAIVRQLAGDHLGKVLVHNP